MTKPEILMITPSSREKLHISHFTLIVKFPGCLSVLKVATKDVFTQLCVKLNVTFCPRVKMVSCNGQSGQYTPLQQNL